MEKENVIQKTMRCPECGSPNTSKIVYDHKNEIKSEKTDPGAAYYQCSDCENIFSLNNIQ